MPKRVTKKRVTKKNISSPNSSDDEMEGGFIGSLFGAVRGATAVARAATTGVKAVTTAARAAEIAATAAKTAAAARTAAAASQTTSTAIKAAAAAAKAAKVAEAAKVADTARKASLLSRTTDVVNKIVTNPYLGLAGLGVGIGMPVWQILQQQKAEKQEIIDRAKAAQDEADAKAQAKLDKAKSDKDTQNALDELKKQTELIQAAADAQVKAANKAYEMLLNGTADPYTTTSGELDILLAGLPQEEPTIDIPTTPPPPKTPVYTPPPSVPKPPVYTPPPPAPPTTKPPVPPTTKPPVYTPPKPAPPTTMPATKPTRAGPIRGGVMISFSPVTERGKKQFLDWVNERWKYLVTQQQTARPELFKSYFTDKFPYEEGKRFDSYPPYYITWDETTQNVRVKTENEFTNISASRAKEIEFAIPIHRRDYKDFFKLNIKPPSQEFSQVLSRGPIRRMQRDGPTRAVSRTGRGMSSRAGPICAGCMMMKPTYDPISISAPIYDWSQVPADVVDPTPFLRPIPTPAPIPPSVQRKIPTLRGPIIDYGFPKPSTPFRPTPVPKPRPILIPNPKPPIKGPIIDHLGPKPPRPILPSRIVRGGAMYDESKNIHNLLNLLSEI